MRIEAEPIQFNEIACSFCGRSRTASWEVVLMDGEHAFICYRDYKDLSDAELILADRRIGEMVWEEAQELRQVLDKEGYE